MPSRSATCPATVRGMERIEFRRTLDDVIAFNLFLSEKLRLVRRRQVWGVVFTALLFGAVAAWRVLSAGDRVSASICLGAGAVWAVVWVRWLAPRLQRSSVRKGTAFLFGKAPITTHGLTLTDAGVEETSPGGDTFCSWRGIPELARTAEHLFLFVGPAGAHIVPVAAFPSKDAADAFFAAAQERKASAERGSAALAG